jgi:NAD(P)H dehydrogenase (quinone)
MSDFLHSVCSVPSTILRCGLYSDFILKHWPVASQTSEELVLPTGHGRVAPISRDDVAAAVAAIAAKPNKSRIIYMITGHRALGFGEIAASSGETIVRQVRYRPCSIDKYLPWASARLDDPWPYAFSTLSASIAEGRDSQVSKDFTAITGREPESFRDFLLRATFGSPADCIADSPFRERHRS